MNARSGTGSRTSRSPTNKRKANAYVASLLSAIYALLITIFALSLEWSEIIAHETSEVETIFYIFMYGGSLLYLTFFYTFMLYPEWINVGQKIIRKFGFCTTAEFTAWDFQADHSGEGTSCLYLRLGVVCFGTLGIVYFGMEIFLNAMNCNCGADGGGSCCVVPYIKYVLGAFFTFIQMHFLFCNSKIRINGYQNLAKYGVMHLIAVNLWAWFRFVLSKQDKKKLIEMKHSNDLGIAMNGTIEAKIFDVTFTLMKTCLVEFSLVGASTMLIVWMTIDEGRSGRDERDRHGSKTGLLQRTKRSSSEAIGGAGGIRVDCTSSLKGLFSGLLYLISAFLAIAVSVALSYSSGPSDTEAGGANSTGSLVLNAISSLTGGKKANEPIKFNDLVDFVLFLIALFACVVGLMRMRHLSYSDQGGHGYGTGNVEKLDVIQLVIGLCGEIAFCSAGLLHWVVSAGAGDKSRHELYLLFLYVSRLAQVLLQTVLILLSGRLRTQSKLTHAQKPGKEFVTFLLLANVTLFVLHMYRGTQHNDFGCSRKSDIGDDDSNERDLCSRLPTHDACNYGCFRMHLTQIVMPLVVFFRFHSSVCLAETFKHCYTLKEAAYQGERDEEPAEDEGLWTTDV